VRTEDRAPICTSCAGFSISYACSECGQEGKLHAGRRCTRCTFTRRVAELLDDGTGRTRPELASLAELLTSMDNPLTGLAWVSSRHGRSALAADLLRGLGRADIKLSHDAFHRLQPWPRLQVAAHRPGQKAPITQHRRIGLLRKLITDDTSTATNRNAGWLFPGRRSGQPLTTRTIAPLIRDLGVPTVPGRLAALHQLVLQAPAPVVAQALSFHHTTTQRHHAAAGGTWNRYSPSRSAP
jgi:hypothetical protein